MRVLRYDVMGESALRRLRIHAISQSFFPPTTLKSAIQRMGFVQADPIRSPARAQDLILRHRANGYAAGDLERQYASLDIEEDVLYAYGFLPRSVWRLLHPRNTRALSSFEKKVLETVRRFGQMHPRELEAHFGRKRVINAWGGYSKATTSALEDLHFRGLLRIARRENGIRIYEAPPPLDESLSPQERLRKLILVVAKAFAPAPENSLRAAMRLLRRIGPHREIFDDMLRSGELEKQIIDGIPYVWPPRKSALREVPRCVRFLAPFDPVVWDRRRFEHFWGWPYRFEAYTPTAKRLRGYYAMPLLWCEDVIGWANVSGTSRPINIELGFVDKRPTDAAFHSELEAEIARIETFLR